MPERTAEVVIIGGGVVGASVAYHLAVRGARDVLVLDAADAPGAGSTGRAAGGFRTQFATPVNIHLSLLSRQKLLRFPEEVGGDPGYAPHGYLFLAINDRQLSLLREFLAVQRAAGLREVEEVTPDVAASLNHAVDMGPVVGGVFCPLDGYIRPVGILEGYLAAARRLGVRVEFGTGPARCEREGPRITGVRTPRQRISTRAVVNAAGAWAGEVARAVGVDLPVRPARRQVAVTHPFAALPETMPMTVFLDDGFHLRVRDARVLLLWRKDVPAHDPFDTTTVNHAMLHAVLARGRRHVPALRDAHLDGPSCWVGLYEMSPDQHAIVGPAPEVEGFYLVNGSSGHGVMHAPALGQVLAEQILDGAAQSVDITALRPGRFAEGRLNVEPGIL